MKADDIEHHFNVGKLSEMNGTTQYGGVHTYA